MACLLASINTSLLLADLDLEVDDTLLCCHAGIDLNLKALSVAIKLALEESNLATHVASIRSEIMGVKKKQDGQPQCAILTSKKGMKRKIMKRNNSN